MNERRRAEREARKAAAEAGLPAVDSAAAASAGAEVRRRYEGAVEGSGVNPLTTMWRKALLTTYEAIGGDKAFARWASREKAAFYRLIKDSAPREREANAAGSGVNIQINTYSGGEPATVEIKGSGGHSDPE